MDIHTLKLDFNECSVPFDTENSSIDIIKLAQINRYSTPIELESRLAQKHNIHRSQLVVTAGADEGLSRAAHAFLDRSSHFITTTPTFPMILHYAAQTTPLTTSIPWLDETCFPCQKILDAISDRTKLVTLASPNNPTGSIIEFSDIKKISHRLQNGILLLDTVYTDFADNDLAHRAHNLNNVVTLHSLSKSWGLAGLRIGYAIGPEHLIERLRQAGSPFPISCLSLQFVLTHFSELEIFAAQSIVKIKQEREQLFTELTNIGGKPLLSQANFVFAAHNDAENIFARLKSQGVVCKLFPKLSPNNKSYLRVTCPGNDNDFLSLVRHVRNLKNQSEISLN